jgi:hypothetical protein
MDFPPILILVILWLLISLPLSKIKKASQGQQAARTASAPKARQPERQPAKAAAPAVQSSGTSSGEGSSFRPAVLQPTITFTEHDDSVYAGSMNAVTGEGYDPCHDEQLAPLTLAENAVPAAEAAEGGLQLNWTGNEIVRGIVMSEILKRK